MIIVFFFFHTTWSCSGSIAEYEIDESGMFKYLLICLAASIDGWTHCRPVICVDGTHLKYSYSAKLLVSCIIDGNNESNLSFGIS